MFTKDGTTYLKEQVTDSSRRISVEIGDKLQAEFFPQVKSLFWDNETNFSLRLVDEGKGVVSEKGEVIEWVEGDRTARFYSIEGYENGGVEFEVEFASKPTTNTVEFSTQTKEFEFFKQLPLIEQFPIGSEHFGHIVAEGTATELKDSEGNVFSRRPENMVGGYVAYHATKNGYVLGQKNYATGQAFVLPRPFITDADGKRIWCDQEITEGFLTVTIPQDFLDTAIYPIILDPDVGYTTAGSSSTTFEGVIAVTGGTTGVTAGTGDSISAYIKEDDGAGNHSITGNLYLDGASDTLVANGATATLTDVSLTASWRSMAFTVDPTIAASTAYLAAIFPNIAVGQISIFYNAASPNSLTKSGETYPTFPDPLGGSDAGVRASIYFTYTEGGAAATPNNLTLLGVGV